MKPINRPAIGVTKPAPGVTLTSPAPAPVMPPSMLGLRFRIHSTANQPITPAAAPKWVTVKAEAARLEAVRALPALNPNQPIHNRQAPMKLRGRLLGRMALCDFVSLCQDRRGGREHGGQPAQDYP